jgi:hypothetical protein
MFPVREKASFDNIIHSARHLSVKHLYRMLELLKTEPYLLTFEIQPITFLSIQEDRQYIIFCKHI